MCMCMYVCVCGVVSVYTCVYVCAYSGWPLPLTQKAEIGWVGVRERWKRDRSDKWVIEPAGV